MPGAKPEFLGRGPLGRWRLWLHLTSPLRHQRQRRIALVASARTHLAGLDAVGCLAGASQSQRCNSKAIDPVGQSARGGDRFGRWAPTSSSDLKDPEFLGGEVSTKAGPFQARPALDT